MESLPSVKTDIRVYSSRVRSERARKRPVITENRTRNYPINNTSKFITHHYKTPKYFRLVANITMEDRNLFAATKHVKCCLCYRDIKDKAWDGNLDCVLRFQLFFCWVQFIHGTQTY